MQANLLDVITIDRRSSTPFDEQIKDRIKASILDQTLYYQTALPSIKEVAKTLGIKESKVKKTYDSLEDEGFIRKIDGEYSVIYFELTDYFFDRNTAIYDAIKTFGLEPSIRCLTREVVHLEDGKIRSMGFDPKECKDFFHIKRIYSGNDQPIMVLENYLPITIFPDINEAFVGTEPLNAFLRGHYGIEAQVSERVTKAVNIDKNMAKLLNERVNAASIQSTNHIYDKIGRLIDYGRSHSARSYYFQLLSTRQDMEDGCPSIFDKKNN